MRAVVQRVLSASVVDNADGSGGSIGSGLLLLVGIHCDDTETNARKLADKIVNLRVFNDVVGKMNISLLDLPKHEILAVSNFTVYGDTKKSRRPSFGESAPYEQGRILFNEFVSCLRTHGFKVPTGVFGADMAVSLVNDGPVTLVVDA